MNRSSYALVARPGGGQTAAHRSYLGGRPSLPPGTAVPGCELCGSPQTFFLQVAFPDDHPWSGRSLAVFACTSCADENHLIPEMLQGSLRGADIPAGFLDRYQRNFRFEVFETAAAEITAGRELVDFLPLSLEPATTSEPAIGRLGGSPQWLLDDESPATYDGRTAMVFLFQLDPDLRFPTAAGAPPQTILGLRGTPEPSKHPHYELFIANGVYFFGTADRDPPRVYALTQID